MAEAFQPSEGFYAALCFEDTSTLTSLESNFTALQQKCMKTFRDDSRVVGTNKKGFIDSMKIVDKKSNKIDNVMGSLGAGISAVKGMRNLTRYKGIPDKVYMTGGKWPSRVEKFKLEWMKMKDYNSSDVIMEYTNDFGKPHFVGVSLKEKQREKAADPPLINNAFFNFIKNNPKFVKEIDDHRKKFFAEVILEGTKKDNPLYGITQVDGKNIANMSVNNASDIESLWNAKVAVEKKGEQIQIPLINLKGADHLIERNGISDKNGDTPNAFRKFVNERLQSRGSLNPLFDGFLKVMNKKEVKDKLAATLLSRVLKIDLYNELDTDWDEVEFDFYLAVGVGNFSNNIGSVGAATITSLESIMVSILSMKKEEAKIVYNEKLTTAANAAKVFFTLKKGNNNVLDVELRYGGNFKASPRFHANFHPDFEKIIGRAQREVL